MFKLKFKREFPILWAKASTWVATPLFIVMALLYMQDFISKSASEIYGFGLSAVGISAALSAICLSTAPLIGMARTLPILRWTGEKFLHSCLLLIQMLIVAYARDSVLAWEWVARQDELKLAVGVLANAAGLFVATTAAWCWYGHLPSSTKSCGRTGINELWKSTVLAPAHQLKAKGTADRYC